MIKMKLMCLALVAVVPAAGGAMVSNNQSFFLMTSSIPGSDKGGSVLRMDAGGFGRFLIGFSRPLHNPRAVVYDPRSGQIFWTEMTPSIKIRRGSLCGGEVYTLIEFPKTSDLGGLAVDPEERLIFYSDKGRDLLGTVMIPPKYKHEIIINSGMQKPGAIALNIYTKMMYWADVGRNGRIERARYDGTCRRTIIQDNNLAVLALALDPIGNRLFWIDGNTKNVLMSNLEGKGRNVLMNIDRSDHTFGLTYFQEALYITDFGQHSRGKSSTVTQLRLGRTRMKTVLAEISNVRINDIHAYEGPRPNGHPVLKARWTAAAVIAAFLVIFIAS